MVPFVPNGVYKIRNVEYPHDVAGLVGGVSIGSIIGYIDQPGKPNPYTLWKIKNVGGGGNEITIESVYSPGTFAGAEFWYPEEQLSGSTETVWTVVKQDRGYNLQSPDGKFVWQLTRDGKCAMIVMIPHTGKYDTQWTFDRVRN